MRLNELIKGVGVDRKGAKTVIVFLSQWLGNWYKHRPGRLLNVNRIKVLWDKYMTGAKEWNIHSRGDYIDELWTLDWVSKMGSKS